MRSDFCCFTTITRLINHSMDQSRDQSIDRSITRSINYSTDQSADRSFNYSIDQSPDRSINHSINQLIINQSLDRSPEKSMAIEQFIDRLIGQSKHFMFYNFFTCRYGCFVRIDFFIFFFQIWARILRTLRIQHVQLRSYTDKIGIVTDRSDSYGRLVRSIHRIRIY